MADDLPPGAPPGLSVGPGGVPFEEAIAALRGKVPLPSRAWGDLYEGMHARGFVVAGATQAALVSDFQEAVTKAVAEGRTLAQFREDFDRIVAAHGWSYRGSRGWRSAVIYNTNMRMAQSAGRWAQAARVAERERRRGRTVYIRYLAVLDSRTRPAHRRWHDVILPIDHHFWDTHFPPNGWNCRCTVQVLTQRQLTRMGLTPTREEDLPSFGTEPRRIRSGGEERIVETPAGVDPGFGYNPGVAGFGRGPSLKAMEAHDTFETVRGPFDPRPEDLPPLPVTEVSARLGPPLGDDIGQEQMRRALRDALGAEEAVFTDPIGGRVLINQALADHLAQDWPLRRGRERYLPLLPELVEAPSEIWVGFARSTASGRVVLRRRYVRLFRLSRDTSVSLATDIDDGYFAAVTVFQSRGRPSAGVRAGHLAYRGFGGDDTGS